MTYQVLVANEWQNMIVKVEAGDPRTAHEVVEWIVKNRERGDAHGIPQDEKMRVEWSP
jgi:hypothetical protein